VPQSGTYCDFATGYILAAHHSCGSIDRRVGQVISERLSAGLRAGVQRWHGPSGLVIASSTVVGRRLGISSLCVSIDPRTALSVTDTPDNQVRAGGRLSGRSLGMNSQAECPCPL
jgi:hypothetical protein